MWTAELVNKTIKGGILTCNVKFTNGSDIVEEIIKTSKMSDLKAWAKSRIKEFTDAESLLSDIGVGAIDISDPVVAPPPALTQEQLDEAQWMTDYAKWVKIKATLIDTGILTGSETSVANLKTKVQANFKPIYLANLM